MSAALLEYLEQLPGLAFKRLYEQPSTVLAVLRRMLPHLGTDSDAGSLCLTNWIIIAKTMVMAMLYMPEPLLESDLYTWVRPESRK